MPTTDVTPKLSVVIPTYNRCDLLKKTLNQLVSQRMPANEFEVIVSDDGSSDSTEAVAMSFGDRLRMKYTFQEDLGFRAGMARNAGARLATAPVLVFLDTGCIVGKNFLENHLSAHRRDKEHPVAIGYAYGWTGTDEPVAGIVEALRQFPPEEVVTRFSDHSQFRDIRHQILQEFNFDLSGQNIPWLMLLSLNFSVGAEDFWAVEGFDEALCGWGFEDIELGYRLYRHGLSFTMERDAWVIEWPHDRFWDANIRDAGINMARFLRKHQEPSAEILWWALHKANMWFCEHYYTELSAWRAQARGMDVAAELATATRQIPPGDRVALIGSGGDIPSSLAGATAIDFDQELVERARATGIASGHHAIGLRTPLADQSVDTVLITSRMAGVWERWGEDILAEGRRIGRNVLTLG